jgi:hypothetical protein
MVSAVEEFLMPTLEEEGPAEILFQDIRAAPYFKKEVIS